MKNKQILIIYIIGILINLLLLCLNLIDSTWSIVFLIVLTIAYVLFRKADAAWSFRDYLIRLIGILFTGYILRLFIIMLMINGQVNSETLLYKTIYYTNKINYEKLTYMCDKNNRIKEDRNKNQIYVFYKLGCPICDETKEELQNYLKKNNLENNENILYINVESELGKKLVNEFRIDHSYYIVFRNKNGMYKIVDRSNRDYLDSNQIKNFLE